MLLDKNDVVVAAEMKAEVSIKLDQSKYLINGGRTRRQETCNGCCRIYCRKKRGSSNSCVTTGQVCCEEY